jgi:nucleotide-binding universal stress UspA family protein
MDFKKILCPIDFSDTSRAALETAVALAGQLGAELTLLHVYQMPSVTLPDGFMVAGAEEMARLSRDVDEAMQKWRADAEAQGATRLRTETAIGATHAEIERIAAAGGYHLVVMGTHGRTGLAHALLGSTAEKVVQRASCPVVTVRPRG